MPTGKAPVRTCLPSSVNVVPSRPGCAPWLDEIMVEIVSVVFRLESDEIVEAQAAQDLLMARQGDQNVGRRAGDVQIEADRVRVTPRAQFLGERHQVIVVHPDDVVLLDQFAELVGE